MRDILCWKGAGGRKKEDSLSRNDGWLVWQHLYFKRCHSELNVMKNLIYFKEILPSSE